MSEEFEVGVTAFILVKTMPEWLALTVSQRIEAFRTEVVPVVEEKAKGVRSRFYEHRVLLGAGDRCLGLGGC